MTRTVGIFLYDDFQILDASGPVAVFEVAEQMAGNAYRFEMLSRAGGSVRSSAGPALETEPAHAAAAPDTLIVVGGNGCLRAMDDTAATAWLRSTRGAVRRLCAVCSGSFLLAAAGLLDGRRATTHWRWAAELAERFPDVRVEPDRMHVQDGQVWTSAGVTGGIDLALALVAEDLGEALARRVAQHLVVYYRRPGGQSQFSALAELGGDGTIFSSLLDWMRGHLRERLTVEHLAQRMAMSPRNFSRRFIAAVGMSPAKAVERLRLDVARERVENSAMPIEQIAQTLGFHDPERMRRAFVRGFGQPPQAMRRNATAQR